VAQSTPPATQSLEELAINTVRTLAMDAVQQAESGHPGTPMALAPLGYVLFRRHLRFDPADPHWPDRDRFVLSCGHASMLLYSLLYLTGYDLALDDLKQFRQWGSRTPGHPEYGFTPGVETTTGPLGQGVGNAVGMAVAEAHLAAVFNREGHRILDHHTYFVASDGDIMEGISHEAASFAGHFKLAKLIGFYDDNRITIDGSTELTYSDDAAMRFESYGWHVQRVQDVNDLDALDEAIERAKQETERPSLIIVRTRIGYGSPNRVDTSKAHGEPLGAEEIRLTKQALGWPSLEPFHVPDDALAHWREAQPRGAALHEAWRKKWDAYAAAFPEEARELDRRLGGKLRGDWASGMPEVDGAGGMTAETVSPPSHSDAVEDPHGSAHRAMRGELPGGWESALPTFTAETGAVASRAASGRVLNAIAPNVPELIGGSADLAGSNLTTIKDITSFAPGRFAGRNMHFGIREHGMASIMNGMALHGGVIPYGGTFLVFADYMRPAIRLAALMGLHVIYVFTHDSIGLGEDGPTHQPVEQLTSLRCIPGMTVIRPADAGETVEAWRAAVSSTHGPVALVLTRQKLGFIDRHRYAAAAGVAKGGYTLAEASGGVPRAVLMSSGSEVALVLRARERLEHLGVASRVVSMPSLDIFARQPAEYRESVLPRGTLRVAVEAAHPMSWHHWVGADGIVLGIERFGASAPYERVYEELGLTAEGIVTAVLRALGEER
jgi:transketolase